MYDKLHHPRRGVHNGAGLAALTLGMALALPSAASAQTAVELAPYTGGPVPAGMRLVERPQFGIIRLGVSFFGVSYGLSALVGLLGGRKNSDYYLLAVPFAGPLLFAGAQDVGAGARAILTVDAIFQVGGVALIGLAYVLRSQFLAPEGVAQRAPRWDLSPGTLAGTRGLTLSVTF